MQNSHVINPVLDEDWLTSLDITRAKVGPLGPLSSRALPSEYL